MRREKTKKISKPPAMGIQVFTQPPSAPYRAQYSVRNHIHLVQPSQPSGYALSLSSQVPPLSRKPHVCSRLTTYLEIPVVGYRHGRKGCLRVFVILLLRRSLQALNRTVESTDFVPTGYRIVSTETDQQRVEVCSVGPDQRIAKCRKRAKNKAQRRLIERSACRGGGGHVAACFQDAFLFFSEKE